MAKLILVFADIRLFYRSSGLSSGGQSFITDVNSTVFGITHLVQSTDTAMEPYVYFPSLPVAVSSNDSNISCYLLVDGSPISQLSQIEQMHQEVRIRQERQGCHAAISQTLMQTSRASAISSTNNYAPRTSSQMQNKLRLDMRQDNIIQHGIVQQLLLKADTFQHGSYNSHFQALTQKHRLLAQQLQKIRNSNIQPNNLDSQHQHYQMAQQVRPPEMHHISSTKHSLDGGLCSRRLMQYMYHLRQRPTDNNILYWRKFVAEYYSPKAKRRWCLSTCNSVRSHALEVSLQDAWLCGVCGSKSGKGFEATIEVLPRIFKANFDSGVIDELLYLDMPHEYSNPCGLLILEYAKAVEESVYEHLRVVREGWLRIIFSPDLKMLSWEFCVRRHEELLSRKSVLPKVNQLVQAALKYQKLHSGGSPQDLQKSCNTLATAGCQLAKNMELQLVDGLGYSRRFIRCLQISQIVNSLKDLMTFSCEASIGPIESLQIYAREMARTKRRKRNMQEKEQLQSAEHEVIHPTPSNDSQDISNKAQIEHSTGSEQASSSPTSLHQKMHRGDSLKLNTEKTHLMERFNTEPSPSVYGSKKSSSKLVSGSSSSNSSLGSQSMKHRTIQTEAQEMVRNSKANSSETETGSKQDAYNRFTRSYIGNMPSKPKMEEYDSDLVQMDTGVYNPFASPSSLLGRLDNLKRKCSSGSGMYASDSYIKKEPNSPGEYSLPERDFALGVSECWRF